MKSLKDALLQMISSDEENANRRLNRLRQEERQGFNLMHELEEGAFAGALFDGLTEAQEDALNRLADTKSDNERQEIVLELRAIRMVPVVVARVLQSGIDAACMVEAERERQQEAEEDSID